jgi:hypothetical protein
VPGIIDVVAGMDRAGKDLQRVVMELLEHFRNLLVVLYAGKDASALELPEAQIAFYEQHAAETEAGRVLRIIDALVETDGRMRYALSKKTLLETGLIRCSRAAETATINELLKQVAELKKNFKPGAASVAVAESPAQNYAADPQKKKPATDEMTVLRSCWHDIIDHAATSDPLSRRYFLDTVPVRIDATHLFVGFDPEFSGELERFDNARTKLGLARAVEKHSGRLLSISFEPLSPGGKLSLPADTVVSDISGDSTAELTGLQKWYANPVVKTVVEAFNGGISDIRE